MVCSESFETIAATAMITSANSVHVQSNTCIILSKWRRRRLQVLSEQAIRLIPVINLISSIRKLLNLIFGSTLCSDSTLFLFNYYC